MLRSEGLCSYELKALAEILERFEISTLRDTGMKKISGGFATADMYDYDDERVDILLIWGIKDGTEDTEHCEHWGIERQILNEYHNKKISLSEAINEIHE